MQQICKTVSHADEWDSLSQYEIKGNQIYRTISHMDGWADLLQYEIK